MVDKSLAIPKVSVEFKSFYLVSKMLYELVDSYRPNEYMFPHAVNAAFACELGLKLVLMHEDVPFERTHKLAELVSLLPSKQRAKLYKAITQVNSRWNERDIIDGLGAVSNIFVYARYMYEYSFQLDSCFLDTLLGAINQLLAEYPRYSIRKVEDVSPAETMEQFLRLE